MRTAVPSKIVSSTVPLAPHPKGTSYGDAEASPSGRSTQRQGDKRQRRSRLNRVKCTVAKRQAQSTSEWPKTLPRGFKGPQPLDTPFSPIFRRASKDGVPEGRWKSRAAGKKRTAKDIATGGRNEKIAPRKTAQSQFCHNKKAPTQGTATLVLFLTDRHLSGEKSYRSGKKERRKPEMETRRRFMLPSYHIPRSSV